MRKVWETRRERQSEQDRLVERFTRRVPRANEDEHVTVYSQLDGDVVETRYVSIGAALTALSADEGLALTRAQVAALGRGERIECRDPGNLDATLALWLRGGA